MRTHSWVRKKNKHPRVLRTQFSHTRSHTDSTHQNKTKTHRFHTHRFAPNLVPRSTGHALAARGQICVCVRVQVCVRVCDSGPRTCLLIRVPFARCVIARVTMHMRVCTCACARARVRVRVRPRVPVLGEGVHAAAAGLAVEQHGLALHRPGTRVGRDCVQVRVRGS